MVIVSFIVSLAGTVHGFTAHCLNCWVYHTQQHTCESCRPSMLMHLTCELCNDQVARLMTFKGITGVFKPVQVEDRPAGALEQAQHMLNPLHEMYTRLKQLIDEGNDVIVSISKSSDPQDLETATPVKFLLIQGHALERLVSIARHLSHGTLAQASSAHACTYVCVASECRQKSRPIRVCCM